MKLSKLHIENKAILLEESEMIQLKKFFEKNYSRVYYSAKCIDDTKIDFDNFDDLIEYENPDFRKIISLIIYADNKTEESNDVLSRYGAEFEINIGSKYSSQTLEYRLNSDDHTKATHFESELKLRLKSIRPWYWLISKTSFSVVTMVFSFGFLALQGIRYAYLRNKGITIVESKSNITTSETIIYVVLGILFVVLLIIGLDKIKEYLFPKTLIKLGQQKNRSIKGNRVIYFVFAVIILSILINLASNWIWDIIK